ncbi:hypothetical protein Dimus_013838, partial [Dionaea muscipula]
MDSRELEGEAPFRLGTRARSAHRGFYFNRAHGRFRIEEKGPPPMKNRDGITPSRTVNTLRRHRVAPMRVASLPCSAFPCATRRDWPLAASAALVVCCHGGCGEEGFRSHDFGYPALRFQIL